MIRELRLYWRLRPYLSQLQKELHMKFSWNVVTQILLTTVQGANAVSSLFPPKTQAGIAVVVGVVQAVIAAIAHFSNPDGTPAAMPYKPDAAKSAASGQSR